MPKTALQQLLEQASRQAKTASRDEKLLSALHDADSAPRCTHVKANGVRCKSPAMRGEPFCFFHERFYNPPYDDSFPSLEDANSVQCAIVQVLNQLKSKIITLPEARVMLYGLKAASINSRRTNFDAPRAFEEQVTEYPLGRRPEPGVPRNSGSELRGWEPAIPGLDEYRNISESGLPLRPDLAAAQAAADAKPLPIRPAAGKSAPQGFNPEKEESAQPTASHSAAEHQIPRSARDDNSNGGTRAAQASVGQGLSPGSRSESDDMKGTQPTASHSAVNEKRETSNEKPALRPAVAIEVFRKPPVTNGAAAPNGKTRAAH